MAEFAADLPAVLERAVAGGVAVIVCVGVDLNSSREAVELAHRQPGIVAAVGVHPNEASALRPGWLDELRALACMPRVVALGEMGLDYYRERTDPERQRELFRAQLDLAGELGLPVVVHNREADRDMAKILGEWSARLSPRHPRGVLHCFSGELPLMNDCVAVGFYLSFAGPITFRNAGKAAETVIAAPKGRLLLETDAPYLAPHPYRGRRNEPAFVRLVAERMAEVRHESLDDILMTTGDNAARLFGLEQPPATTSLI